MCFSLLQSSHCSLLHWSQGVIGWDINALLPSDAQGPCEQCMGRLSKLQIFVSIDFQYLFQEYAECGLTWAGRSLSWQHGCMSAMNDTLQATCQRAHTTSVLSMMGHASLVMSMNTKAFITGHKRSYGIQGGSAGGALFKLSLSQLKSSGIAAQEFI